jgi:hypothetical protein
VTVAPGMVGPLKIAISRSFKINVGNYEAMDSFVSVTQEVPKDFDLTDLATHFGEILDTLQSPDLELAHFLSKEKKSIVHDLIKK